MRNRVGLLVVVVILVGAGAVWAADPPVAVSPGSATGTVIESRCPTFSWDAVEGVVAHELVVYQVGQEGQEAEPIVKQEIPGSASSWTPPLESCLERGGQYAWSVRAIGSKEAPDWSAPSLFQVATGPGRVDFEAALQVVRSYLEAEAVSQRVTEPPAEAGLISEAGTIGLSVDSSLARVASGEVALGEGAIALNPDLKMIGTIQQGVTAGIKVVDPSSCGSANRGEIRLFNLSGTGGRIDALCFCARQKLDGEIVATHNWSCLKVPVFPPD